MKYIAIIDESEKFDLEEKGILKGCKPIFKEMLVGTDGQSVYLTQEHLDCLIEWEKEYFQRKMIEREKQFFDNMNLFGEMVAELKGE